MSDAVFVDTSAFYAMLDRDDEVHVRAAQGWHALLDGVAAGSLHAITHSGVVIETCALIQRRLGIDALRAFDAAVLRTVEVIWIDEQLHRRAMSAVLAARRRDVSLVDRLSFEVLRDQAVRTAFAFDDDFAAEGFAPWVAV